MKILCVLLGVKDPGVHAVGNLAVDQGQEKLHTSLLGKSWVLKEKTAMSRKGRIANANTPANLLLRETRVMCDVAQMRVLAHNRDFVSAVLSNDRELGGRALAKVLGT